MGASNLVLNSEETSLSLYTIACPELQRRDAVGNRLSTVSDSGWTYDSSNHLTSRPGVTYTYDNNGNTATKVDSTGTTTYAWNYDDQLASATLPGSAGTVTFKYDPFGRRIQKASPSGTTNYLYDGANVIEEVDGTGTVLARYSQGAGIDQPLDVFTSGGTKYYDADGLGSITSLADISGSLTDTYTTDSFGKATASSGTTRNPFRYTARDLDSETGLYYYRARYYDPKVGRFNAEDSVRFTAGPNFYPYATNNPIRFTDPTGHNPALVVVPVVVVVGVGLVATYYVVTNPSVQQGLQQAAQSIGGAVTNFFKNPPWHKDKPQPIPFAPPQAKCKDKERCKQQLNACIEECIDELDKGEWPFRRCIAAGMDRAGCDYTIPRPFYNPPPR